MELTTGDLHSLAVYAAVLLGVVGPFLGIVYSLHIDRRDFWRKPMLAVGTLTFLAVLGVSLSGQPLGAQRDLAGSAMGSPELEYADRLLLPGTGFFVLVLLTGLLNPRTGVLRTVLPMLLTCFSVMVLVLTVLGSSSGARMLLDRVLDSF